LRFEDNNGGYGRVKGVTVHNGEAYGMGIYTSKNIEVTDIVVAGFKQFGLVITTTTNVTVDTGLISNIVNRGLVLVDNMADKESCVSVGAHDNTGTGDPVTSTYIKNLIAAGCPYAGFVVPSYPCDNNDESFHNNVAHSVNGCGANIYPSPADGRSATCMEGSHFAAYKNVQ